MSKIEHIESDVKSLSSAELAQFRAWFFEFDAETWDRKIAAHQQSGQLNGLMVEALQDFQSGKAREV